jgi:hypothetical protein
LLSQRWARSNILESYLSNRIFAKTGFTASFNETIEELMRGIRMHFPKLLKSKSFYFNLLLEASEDDIKRAQLGLAH